MVAWVILATGLTAEAPRLSHLLGSGAILQREADIPLMGYADPGSTVTVLFADKEQNTTASDTGEWSVIFPAMDAGGPYSISVKSDGGEALSEDVWVGDLWICSGQSNMELPVQRVAERYAHEIASSADPRIREYRIAYAYDFEKPQTELPEGAWLTASPGTIRSFSAVGWFFARELVAQTGVPIGLINASVGGSPIEAWMSESAVSRYRDKWNEVIRYREPHLISKIEARNTRIQEQWHGNLNSTDQGLTGSIPWYDFEYQPDSSWKPFTIPAYWDEYGLDMFGSVWFRRDIVLPDEAQDQPAMLRLGTIVDSDHAYINGQKVGNTGYQYPPRRYSVPAGVLKGGKNVIVVRVIADSNIGGFVSEKPYVLEIGNESYQLSGEWMYKVGTVTPKIEPTEFVRWKPLGLFNGMIAPLTKHPVKGVLWYQGESNISEAQFYQERLTSLIYDWRSHWKNESLPFVYAQLPILGKPASGHEESGWAMLRDAQRRALRNPGTAMAVTLDLGEWNDIHPENKKDVGVRLANEALRLVYGKQVLSGRGPIVSGAERVENRVRILFESTDSGVTTRDGGNPEGFAIAGRDGKYHDATASFEDGVLWVWNEDVTLPVSVRYAWADNPAHANVIDVNEVSLSTFQIKVEATPTHSPAVP